MFYDVSVSNACREPIAAEVKDKDRANFCDYFKIKSNAFDTAKYTEQKAARKALEELFSASTTPSPTTESSTHSDNNFSELENLFKK